MSRMKDYLFESEYVEEPLEYVYNNDECTLEDSFDHESYLDSITNNIIPKYKNVINTHNIFPKNKGNLKFKNINLNNSNLNFKFEYLSRKISPEEFVIKYYQELGYNALFTENNYWIVLFLLYYFDDLDLPSYISSSFILNETQLNKKLDFKKVLTSNNIDHIIKSYISHFYAFWTNSDRYLNGYYNVEELLIACINLNPKQLSLIFERIWQDFNYFNNGLPDLIVYNEEEFFFVEVKSENDNPSFKQIQWHKFLVDVVHIDVVLFSINKNSKQFNSLKNKYNLDLLTFDEKSKDDKLYLKPAITTFTDYETDTIFLTYFLKHSSGFGNEKNFIEILKLPYDSENTSSYKYEDIINLSEDNKDLVYKKILKQYPPEIFVDYRPSRNQLKRNMDAEILEGKGKYDEAIKLYEKNVSERTGSPTTYKRLIKIYKRLNKPLNILNIIEIAIPIFTTLDNKSMVLTLVHYKNEAIYQKEDMKFLKVLTPEENDYLYEHCCVDDVKVFIIEKIKELESNASGDYSSEGYCLDYV